MLFDSGADYPYIDDETASMVKIKQNFPRVSDGYPPGYLVPLTIVGLPPLDIVVYLEHQTEKLLPPRIFTEEILD